MKIPAGLLLSLIIIASCSRSSKVNIIVRENLGKNFTAGNLDLVIRQADSLRPDLNDATLFYYADSLADIAERIKIDFPYTSDQIIDQLTKRIGAVSLPDIKYWEDKGWLEYRIINGEKRYFSRAASNLVLLKEFNLNRASRDSTLSADPDILFRKSHTSKILSLSSRQSVPVEPVEMEIVYTITVEPDAVPAGETVRCWLPFPKENHQRQGSVYLLGVSNEDFILAPDTSIHRTIFMENVAEKGKPVVFMISFSYVSSGQYFDPAALTALPYDRRSELYRKYTAEQPPHIRFSERIAKLTDSITGKEQNPLEITRKIYYWISQNIPWAGALEYSIMADIPGYVLDKMKGDCGMQTFLIMSMLRYKGIPVRWQSGWMVPPGAKNLHDWCEVWFEGRGWVPLDISYGLQFSADQKTREFYITGIDSYRLIINDGIAGKLFPQKNFPRSEPFDFQRGEVEWDGGNLYFDKWDYDMKIRYLNPSLNAVKGM